jgi:hypothetical protein
MDNGFSEARLQELGELFGNHWVAEKITLALATTLLLQKVDLLACFHTFKHLVLVEYQHTVN